MQQDELISLIRSGKTGRDHAINYIYNEPKIQEGLKSVFRKYGAPIEDIDALYNTAIMEFVVTIVRKKQMEIEHGFLTYMKGIAKFVWFRELRKKGKHHLQDIEEARSVSEKETPSSMLIQLERKDLIHQLLSNLGKKCKEVLLLWANGYNMSEIATSMQYKSEGMARKKKYTCMKELTAYISNNPSIKELLIQ